MINYGALKINYGKDEVQISLEVDKKIFCMLRYKSIKSIN